MKEILKDNSKVFRILRLEHLQQFLKYGVYKIPQTKSWDEPYENWLAKADFQFGDIKVPYNGFIECYYGQSWSLNKETDAMWQIYSKGNSGVKIRTSIITLEKLKDSEINSKPNYVKQKIKKIEYLSKNEIEVWTKKRQSKGVGLINKEDLFDSLFIKRPEFKHENEVRIVLENSQTENKKSPAFMTFSIDPNKFIEEIVFDPRMNQDDFKIQKRILNLLGYSGIITQSELYTFDPPSIKM